MSIRFSTPETHPLPRLWRLLYGFAHIADGLIVLLSAGLLSSELTLAAAKRLAQSRALHR